MTFLEKFEEIKKISDVDVKFDKDFAIQINLTDEDCGGAFYVEHRNGTVSVEPYDYYDRDAMMTISSDILTKILTGGVDPVAAFFAGKFAIDGNVDAVLELTKIADAVKAKKKAEEKAKKEAEKKAKEKAKKEAEKKAKAEAEAKAKAEAEAKAKKEAEKKAKKAEEKAKKDVEKKAKAEVEKKEVKKAPAKKTAEKTAKKASEKEDKQMKLDI